MDDKERTYLRRMQDKVCNHLLKKGRNEDEAICFLGPTIAQCKTMVYPDFKYSFEDYIEEWEL